MLQQQPQHALAYGRGTLSVSTGAAGGDPVSPRGLPAFSDPLAAVRAALDSPIGTPPLRDLVKPGEKVCIVVNDITRLTRTDLLLPPILETLNAAGIPDADIFIVFALGIHRLQTPAEQRLIVGEEVANRIRMFDHVSTDDANMVEVGTTSFGNRVAINRQVWEADRIILTGEIIYHLIAGYSGGRKSLVPGVASFHTTTFNHRMIFDPRSRPGNLDGNPAHEDLLEACRLVDPDFIVNAVLSPEGELVRVAAGHFELAHRAGCAAVDEMLRVQLDAPFDLILASAGGFPLDIDLRQAHKGLENACLALKPGGSIVFYAECPSGAGIQSFEDYVNRYDDEFQMKAALEKEFVVGGHKAYWIARLARLYDVHLVSGLDPHFVGRCRLHHVTPDDHQSVVDQLLQRHGKHARVGIIPHAGFTLPTFDGGAATT